MTIVNAIIFIDGTITNKTIYINGSNNQFRNYEFDFFPPIIDHSEQVLHILFVAVFVINKQSDWLKIHENSELAVSELDVDTPQFGQTLLGIAIEFLPITQFFNLKSKRLDRSSITNNISSEIVVWSKNSNPKF